MKVSAGSVVSADSLAWSYGARRRPPLPECRGDHAHCQNCLRYALRWRRKLLDTLDIDEPARTELRAQLRLF